jgi:hypothetical protein
MARKPLLSIVHLELEHDLRTVSARSSSLRRIIKRYKVKEREVVCYINRAMSRFRLVLLLGGVGYLLVPETDEGSKLSVFLRLSEEMGRWTKFARDGDAVVAVSNITAVRIEHRRKWAKRPKKKGQKRR